MVPRKRLVRRFNLTQTSPNATPASTHPRTPSPAGRWWSCTSAPLSPSCTLVGVRHVGVAACWTCPGKHIIMHDVRRIRNGGALSRSVASSGKVGPGPAVVLDRRLGRWPWRPPPTLPLSAIFLLLLPTLTVQAPNPAKANPSVPRCPPAAESASAIAYVLPEGVRAPWNRGVMVGMRILTSRKHHRAQNASHQWCCYY